jgi:hypothetical protein
MALGSEAHQNHRVIQGSAATSDSFEQTFSIGGAHGDGGSELLFRERLVDLQIAFTSQCYCHSGERLMMTANTATFLKVLRAAGLQQCD